MAQPGEPRVAPTSPDEVGDGVRVRHYDELEDSAQQALFSAVHDDDPEELARLPEGVVVFTDYYRVQ